MEISDATPPLIAYADRIPELLRSRKSTTAPFQVSRRYLGIGNASYPFSIPLCGGGSITVDTREEAKVFWHIFVRRCYHLPLPCRTIIDAGANIGIFSIWAARQAPDSRIWALEPSPATYTRLVRHICENSIEHQVQPFRCALAGSTGEREMTTTGTSISHRLLPHTSGGTAVDCITLEGFLSSISSDVDLLKMDIEGSEYEVINATQPSVLQRIKHIELEYHDNGRDSAEDLLARLRKFGFHIDQRAEDACGTGVVRLHR